MHGWTRRIVLAAGGMGAVALVGLALTVACTERAEAGHLWRKFKHLHAHPGAHPPALGPERGGAWYWMRSPEQERRVVIALYNQYCVRCHGIDGRGVWDIPDVPDFTDLRWQASRPDAYLVRVTLEGRGAVMPPFRGTLTLEEAWAMARYLRTLPPGDEVSRPVPGPAAGPPDPPPPPPSEEDLPLPAPDGPGPFAPRS